MTNQISNYIYRAELLCTIRNISFLTEFSVERKFFPRMRQFIARTEVFLDDKKKNMMTRVKLLLISDTASNVVEGRKDMMMYE